MQAGPYPVASYGVDHGAGGLAGENRSGCAANGMPKNLFTVTEEPGTVVATP
jgi:hypothetical protein